MADVAVDPQNSTPEDLVKVGIKAYILKDYNAAVTALSSATELMVAEHGEKHDSLGNVYLYYGKALLEVSREEAEPLGDAVAREIVSDSDDEESGNSATEEQNKKPKPDDDAACKKPEELEKLQEDKMNGSGENKPDVVLDTKPPEESNSKSASDIDNSEVTVQEGASTDEPSSSGTSIEAKVSDEKVPGDGESTDEKVEDEPTDLQLAWEILELAKLIFEQRADVGKKELAETLVTLGEVSLESENFESSIADIKQGLEIQKQILKPDSRNLAETYYKLAIALSTNNQIDEAVENFNVSLNVLNNRIDKLKENEEEQKDEIKDIQALIPEIEEKIADMKSYKEEAANKLVSAIAMKQPPTEAKFEASSSGKQVSNISHLVKRKRKLDDVAEGCEESPAKKQPSV